MPGDSDRPRCPDCRTRTGMPGLMTDGGSPEDEPPDDGTVDPSDAETTADEEPGGTNAESGDNVEITEAGEAEPAEPKWEAPDIDDIPEFEVRAGNPVEEGGGSIDIDGQLEDDSGRGRVGSEGGKGLPGFGEGAEGTNPDATNSDPTAGMPNDAQAPGATAVSGEGTDAYVAALELCAKLPEDVRLPEEAADLVPAAVEAELEQDIQSFAASEFDNPRPHVDTLAFDDVDGEIWLRIRIGVPREGFENVDSDEIRSYALEKLEGVL